MLYWKFFGLFENKKSETSTFLLWTMFYTDPVALGEMKILV